MPADSSNNPTPPPLQAPPSAHRPGAHWMLYGFGTFIALGLVIIATIAITIWWIQRPIKPVVLSPQEKATVDQKLRTLNGDNAKNAEAPESSAFSGNRSVQPKAALSPAAPNPATDVGGRSDRSYVPGSKVLKLTEREINGLLNSNTDLGRAVRLEFAQDAINAYLAVRIPEDFPVGGGKMFRARGRFRVSLGNGNQPYAILEDVTVFGLSLPKAWLGGLKGQNLIGQAMCGPKQWTMKGIKSLRVEPGALVLEVED